MSSVALLRTFQTYIAHFNTCDIIGFSDLIAALEAPGKYPGSCGSRNIKDNLSDLKAQVAANQKVGSVHLCFRSLED